jgi:hypothetical protein
MNTSASAEVTQDPRYTVRPSRNRRFMQHAGTSLLHKRLADCWWGTISTPSGHGGWPLSTSLCHPLPVLRAAGGDTTERLPPKHVKPHRYAESRMDRPPPHVHGKEGSPVRVRQRALKSPANRGFFFRVYLHDPQPAVGIEPFMEPSGREVSPSRAKTATLASRHTYRRDAYAGRRSVKREVAGSSPVAPALYSRANSVSASTSASAVRSPAMSSAHEQGAGFEFAL